jgi:hypothetical protein
MGRPGFGLNGPSQTERGNMSEWSELADNMTWREVLVEYLDAYQRVEHYIQAHPHESALPGPIFFSLSGVRVLFDGLRPIIDNPTRYDEIASREMTDAVLATVRRIRRDVPLVHAPIAAHV